MAQQDDPKDLEDVIDRIESIGDGDEQVSVADIQEVIGRRSFGPLLLVLGLIVLSPVGGIPGVPTAFGLVVLLVAGQLLAGCDSFWLPTFITKRSIKAGRLSGAMDKVRPVARWIDHLLRPRLRFLMNGPARYCVAVSCLVLACLLPALELVPFGAAAPALAVTAFALAMVAEDGILALLGYIATGVSVYLIGTFLVF